MNLPEAVATTPSPSLQRKPTARFGVAALAVAGLGLALWLIAETGFAEVGAAFSHAGWGLLLIVLSDLAGLCFAGLAWHALLRGFWNGPVDLFIRMRWLREAINTLLPVAQIGGDLVGARLLATRGPSPSLAFAGVIADKTVEILAQFVFTVTGFLLLLDRGSGSDLDWGVGVGLVVAGPLLLGFL